jgi:hypothetical protein
MFRRLVAFGALLALASPAAAQQVTFRVQSMYQYKVQIEFYSQNRQFAWPGGTRAYNLDDYAVHTYTLNCNRGERICYGAWVTGNQNKFWGVGLHGRQSCGNCCYRCDGQQTPVIVLNP